MRESQFEKDVIEELEILFPGCVVLKNYPGFIQGFPDRLILWQDKWAALEFKDDESAPFRPNQPYYIALLNEMSFARAIYPQNKEQVLYELQQAWRVKGTTCVPIPVKVPLGKLRRR